MASQWRNLLAVYFYLWNSSNIVFTPQYKAHAIVWIHKSVWLYYIYNLVKFFWKIVNGVRPDRLLVLDGLKNKKPNNWLGHAKRHTNQRKKKSLQTFCVIGGLALNHDWIIRLCRLDLFYTLLWRIQLHFAADWNQLAVPFPVFVWSWLFPIRL